QAFYIAVRKNYEAGSAAVFRIIMPSSAVEAGDGVEILRNAAADWSATVPVAMSATARTSVSLAMTLKAYETLDTAGAALATGTVALQSAAALIAGRVRAQRFACPPVPGGTCRRSVKESFISFNPENRLKSSKNT
ncbi:MAG: hypothetical protein JSS81_27550, partial [Acidobacteria bacterium]|nr:hypothetical protein [Acidobacteriota bacterium]